MHHIQRHILRSLILNPSLRYKDLRPTSVDPNLFMYHLHQLQKEGLIEKSEDGKYVLSSKGMIEADKRQLDGDKLDFYDQPRLVILLAVFDSKKGWLLHTRKTQPLINMTGFIHANPELGESITETSLIRLKKLAGLEGTFEYMGSTTITIYKDNELDSYVHALMVYCKDPKGTLITETPIGTNHWEKNVDFKNPNIIPSAKVLMESISKNEGFFLELTFNI